MPRCRARATNASVRHGSGRRTHRCGLLGCVCTIQPREHARGDGLRAAISLRFHSAMRPATPSVIRLVDSSAIAGGAFTIVRKHRHRQALDHRRPARADSRCECPARCSSSARDVEKLLFRQVARQGLTSGARNPNTSSSMTVSRCSIATFAISWRRSSDMKAAVGF